MRYLSTTALALIAGLTFAGAASADEYISNANRENYAVSAQGHFSGTAPLAAVSTPFNETLLPAGAAPTSHVMARTNDRIVGPFSDLDAHSGPAHSGVPSRL